MPEDPVTYDLSARIDYTFEQATVVGRTLVRMLPADIPGRQRVVSARLKVDPLPAERQDLQDFFGTRLAELAFRQPVDALSLQVEAMVDCLPVPPVLDLSPDLQRLRAEISGCPGLGAEAPHHFLGASERVAPEPEITRWAERLVSPGATVFSIARSLCSGLHAEMKFDASATTVDTRTIDAFRARHGVCQDFTHVMIAALRGLGIPAGYVSGYLRTLPPPGQERLAGADAMHAWVRVWCGSEGGWREFDPTNDLLAGTHHIVAGFGRDYDDVAPVRGVLRSAGAQTSQQAVDVIERI